MRDRISDYVGGVFEGAMRALHRAGRMKDVALVTSVLNELAEELGLPTTVTFELGAGPDAYHYIRNVTINGVTGYYMVFLYGKLFSFSKEIQRTRLPA